MMHCEFVHRNLLTRIFRFGTVWQKLRTDLFGLWWPQQEIHSHPEGPGNWEQNQRRDYGNRQEHRQHCSYWVLGVGDDHHDAKSHKHDAEGDHRIHSNCAYPMAFEALELEVALWTTLGHREPAPEQSALAAHWAFHPQPAGKGASWRQWHGFGPWPVWLVHLCLFKGWPSIASVRTHRAAEVTAGVNLHLVCPYVNRQL